MEKEILNMKNIIGSFDLDKKNRILKSLFFCATPKRCSSSIINNPSLSFGMDPPKILCVPINISTRLLTMFSIIIFSLFCDMKRDNILIVTPNFSSLFLN